MEQMPDKLTGADRVAQENHEFSIEKRYFDSLDRVDRRERRGEITSFVASPLYRKGYDQVNWTIR